MRSLQSWFDEYSLSHRNPINQKIHLVCVPAILFSILAFAWNFEFVGFKVSYWLILVTLPFYISLGFKATLLIVAEFVVSISFLFLLPHSFPLIGAAISLFIVAWIGQFIGHKIEGQRPSFLKDLLFLLVGPLWVFIGKKH